MSKFKVVFDSIIAEGLDIEEEVLKNGNYQNEYELIRLVNDNDEEFLKKVADADAICAYLPLDANTMKQLTKCQVIASPSLGMDPFDLEAATEAGICLCNAPEYCLEEVATHTVALALNCTRRISSLDRHIKAGAWDWTERGKQHRLNGATYGLVSFGNIARRVAEIMKGFGMKIIAYDPFIPGEVFLKNGVERADSLEYLFAQSNILSVHTPYNPKTRHMISTKQFDSIKKTAIIVVTGRGGVVDEEALQAAIKNGKISAAGLDVIEDEVTFNSVLKNMPEVVMTPHCAYYSEESTIELRETNMLQILDVLEHKVLPRYLVNKKVAEKARFLQFRSEIM